MVYVGLLVQFVSDAVAAKLPHDPITMVLRELLDGRSDVTEAFSGPTSAIPASRHSPATSRSFLARGETSPTGYV